MTQLSPGKDFHRVWSTAVRCKLAFQGRIELLRRFERQRGAEDHFGKLSRHGNHVVGAARLGRSPDGLGGCAEY